MNIPALALSAVAIFAGFLFPLQTAINARLAEGVGGPVASTLISFLCGLIALLIIASLTRTLPSVEAAMMLPPWVLVSGGLLGATYLCLNVFLVPRIGAGAVMALVIAGQMLSALVIDKVGAVGSMTRDLSVGRIVGAVIVVVGATMVRSL